MNSEQLVRRPAMQYLNRIHIIAIPLNWLRLVFRLLAITLAGLHAWTAARSHSMNPDGVAYLDIGDAYFRGDWETAINAVWSPMYSWLLGAALWLLQPSMQWEFPTVHLINFLIFLGALVSFEFMWSQLAQIRRKEIAQEADRVLLPEWAYWTVGYALFTWASLNLIQIWAVTPDMLMASFVFLAAGLLARIRAGHDSYAAFTLFGSLLGLGYLSKAIMLPVSVFFLVAGLVAVGNMQRAIPRTLMAIGVFLLVAGPFVLLLTSRQGRFTYGEAGILTYVRHVNGVIYPHWQGEPDGDGAPLYPSRQILNTPPIFEFGTPIGGTYPISFDPAYWYEGVEVRFDPASQIRQVIASGLFYVQLFAHQQGMLVLGIGSIFALGLRNKGFVNLGLRSFLLSFVALSALFLYAPVLVAGRYVGAFVILFWSDLIANASLPNAQNSRRLVTFLGVVITLSLLLNIGIFNLEKASDLIGGTTESSGVMAGPPSWPGEVAEALFELGIESGDTVAVIGYGFDSFWARLARVKIVAELLSEQADPFWYGEPGLQQQVLAVFAGTGARAIVAEYVPSYAHLPGWHRVGDSNFYIYQFAEAEFSD